MSTRIPGVGRSIYYPRRRLVNTGKPSRYEAHCTWVGEPDPLPKPLNVRAFIRRGKRR